MSMFKPRAWEDPKVYSEKLRNYTTEELEDVYYHIHILKQPLYYEMVAREIRARGVAPSDGVVKISLLDIRPRFQRNRFLRDHRTLCSSLIAITIFFATTAITLLLLLPIWLFAVPLKFIGIQTALVYVAMAPVPPVLGAISGAKLGGKGWYSILVVLGVASALWGFIATGTPRLIIEAAFKPNSGGSSMFGGF